jgi:hypothetical protein
VFRLAVLMLLLPVLVACNSLNLKTVTDVLAGSQGGSALSDAEIVAGLKEALAVGTERGIARIGRTDGFWQNLGLRVPLPEKVGQAENVLRRLGQGSKLDAFHLSLNRAAEKAVPEAAAIFGAAIREMTLADARDILRGSDDAATRYFRGKTTATLTARFQPVVARSTDAVGVTRSYKDLLGQAARAVPGLDLSQHDIDMHVTRHALDALFTTLAEEEKKIRVNPAARTTELLRRVFGSG